ncbi:MAG: NTP transferase domain-containing protein [Methanobacteriaceae archaeon]|nr:NTP transferase domain-containing protein [Methanobacteriaceae archaeon]
MAIALVMAGGKGTRMKLDCEKPLVQANGKFLIDCVMDNLQDSTNINDIFIATSHHVPLTEEYAIKKGYKIIKTPGNGYLDDLSFLLSYFESKNPDETLLTIGSDIPCVDGELIDFILNEYRLRYKKSQKPAMCVAVPIELFEKYDLEPSIVLEGIVPSGVNILRSINKIQDEEVLEVPKIELALNINTCKDIKVFEKFFGDNDGRKETD